MSLKPTYIRNPDGSTSTYYCDNSTNCQPICDGHEAPGTDQRCLWCRYKPCQCQAIEDQRNYYREALNHED